MVCLVLRHFELVVIVLEVLNPNRCLSGYERLCTYELKL